ncbi:hypothetical protein CLAIMM_08011 [Cladophialophora immunda]|nr:hypothetical protein CLAIMM_08011 [Cladophialophora immunda]
MSYVTKETVWPDVVALDDNVKGVIRLFYELADNKEAEAGPRMASEVFTPSAKFIASNAAFHGKEEISRCRDNAWGEITARYHQICKVFVSDKECRDLFLLGAVKMGFANGKVVEADFSAHIVVDAQSAAAGRPRLELMHVFAGSVNAGK